MKKKTEVGKLDQDQDHQKVFQKGRKLRREKRYEEAILVFGKVVLLKEEYFPAYNDRGLAYFALRKYGEAIEDYTMYLKLRKDDFVVLSNRALAYTAVGKFKEAVQDCDKAINLKNDSAYAYSWRGNAYVGLQRYNDAILDCNKSIELSKKSPLSYFARGMAYMHLGACAEAVGDLSKAILLKESSAYFKEEKLKHAEVALEEVKKLVSRPHFVQQFFSCQDKFVIEKSLGDSRSSTVFFLRKNKDGLLGELFGEPKKVKVYEGCFMNGKFHGAGVVFDQETGNELYSGEWENGLLVTCMSKRSELKTLFQMKTEETHMFKKGKARWEDACTAYTNGRKQLERLLRVTDVENTRLKEEIATLKGAIDVDLVDELEKLKRKLKQMEKERVEANGVITKLKEKTSLRNIDFKDLDIDFVSPIGSGACADVLSGYLKTRVALKRIKIQFVKKKKFTLLDAKKECKKIGQLNHENVIRCFGVVSDPSKHFLGILTELGKESLEAALGRGLKFPRKISLMIQLAEGMVFLHENRIVHKDLNLRNVLIGFDDKIKIIDFGISKKMIEMKSKILNTSIPGTPFFFAPEALETGKNVEISNLCDVFSFGVCCYCMFFEKTKRKDLEVLLYKGNSTTEATGQLKIVEILSNPKWKPNYPKNFDRSKVGSQAKSFLNLIDSCLQVLPQKRPSFKEIVTDLYKIQKELVILKRIE